MSYGKYLFIWFWLIALLAAGTIVSYLPIAKGGIIAVIAAVSLAKTALVGLFYMHLKFEAIPIWVVVAFPFLLLALAGAIVLLGPLAFA